MAKKRVLHIIKGLDRGGAERLLLSTIPNHHTGYTFDVVYFLKERNQLASELRALGCGVFLIPSSNVFMMLLNLPELIRLIRNNRYALVHAHLPWAGIIARLAGKYLSVPVVYTEHNVFNHYHWGTRLISRLTFRWQQQVIAVSDRVANELQQRVRPTVPVRVITNGVDVDQFRRCDRQHEQVEMMKTMRVNNTTTWLGFPADSIIVGTVTGLSEQKRIDRWLQIATEVSQHNPRIHFVVVGDGIERKTLEALAAPLKAENRLRFVGATSEPSAWLECFDVFLMSSDFEGLPVALLEAMSMECVPVATRVGGIPAVIEHGRQGYLYEPHRWQDAVNQILSLASKPDERKQMGASARMVAVTRFSVRRMVTELEEVYQKVLTPKSITISLARSVRSRAAL